MAAVNKIDSNQTELRYAEETSVGVLPVTPVWKPLDPNDYDSFGGKITTVARNPINSGRQRKKGVVVDLDASGGFGMDLTQDNLQDLMQGFLFADLRTKDEVAVPAVDNATHAYQPEAGGDGYVAGDLLFAKGSSSVANNGLKVVSGTPTATSVVVTDTDVEDESGASIVISRVGHEFGSAVVSVDASGALPKLSLSAGSWADYGLIPGEWICVGDDATANQFANAANNGLKRVRAVDGADLTIDKSTLPMVTDAGTGKTIRVIFARLCRNEVGALVKRRSYQLERSLGQPDDASSNTQSEYLTGSIPNKLEVDVKQADKVTMKLSFMSRDHETRSATDGLKAGTRPVLQDADAFNATSHVVRLSLAAVDPANEAPTDLFAFITDLSLTIDNQVKANKAVKFLGAFDNTAGTLNVDATSTAYFADVAALQTVRSNADVTLDFTFAQANKGITFDLPLVSVGNALADVKQDEAIMLPIENAAASAAKLDVNLNYTVLVMFWDYLPSLAK